MPGTLFVVATPIGHLEDVSPRAQRVLGEVGLIAAEDTRRTSGLLARFGVTTPLTSLHRHNEGLKVPGLILRLEEGQDLALVSDAGTPTVSDPGRTLVETALSRGIRVESVPGPSAIMAALAASGFPADTFTFLGFPPTKGASRASWLKELASARRTVVFFEAPHRILETLKAIMGSLGGSCQVCIARELTKRHEELVVGPISTLIERLGTPIGEFTVVVNVGRITEIDEHSAPGGPALLDELGLLMKNSQMKRRAALVILARRYGLTVNEAYRRIEEAKNKVK